MNPRYPAFGETPGTLPMDQASLPPVRSARTGLSLEQQLLPVLTAPPPSSPSPPPPPPPFARYGIGGSAT